MKKFKTISISISAALGFYSRMNLALFGIMMLFSNIVTAQRPKVAICDLLKVTITKTSTNERNDCCYKISINNSYNALELGQANIPMKFEISTKNPTKIAASSAISPMLVQQPSVVPPLTNTVFFTGKKQLSLLKPLPQGSTDVATICLNNKSTTWLYFSWKNKTDNIICKDSVKVSCESATTSCCAFSLHFSYKKQSANQYKKIRVTALGSSQIVNSDPDEWQQNMTVPTYIEYHLGGSVLPYGEAIDNDFMIYLKQIAGDQLLQVDWFDAGNVIKSSFKIKIPCNGDFNEDQDWTKYVLTGAGADPNTYVFAVKEEDEDDCGYEEKEYKNHDCTIKLDDIRCESNAYKLYLHGPQAPDGADYDEYTWKISKNSVLQTTIVGKNPTPAITLTAGESYTVETIFVIKKGAPEAYDTCSSIGSVIKIPKINPHFNYVKSNPCKLQYDFSVADKSNVTSVAWACTGVSSFPSSGNTVTHEFSSAGTYEITITLTDKYGCTHSKKKSIVISDKCQPNFKWEYSFCHCNYPGKIEVPINVTYTNLSEGGVCPIKYTWQFGDGQTQIYTDSDPRSFDHTYKIPLGPAQDCNSVGKTFTVTLTMEDIKGCKVIKTLKVTVEPCKFHFEVRTCPDGKVMMKAIAKNGDPIEGFWNLPGLSVVDALSLVDAKLSCVVFGASATGTYNISFEGFCPTGGKCKRDTAISVYVDFCTKNEVIKTHRSDFPQHPAFSIGSDEYRMKCKFAQRQYPGYHKVNVKTKLQKKKVLKLMKYWKGHKAEEIEASFKGNLYYRDKTTNVTCGIGSGDCNCKVEKYVEAEEKRNNKIKAKCSKKTKDETYGRRFRTKKESITSTHKVKISGHPEIFNLKLGNYMDTYNWFTDWY